PARFAMIVAFGLAALSAFGMTTIAARFGRAAISIAALIIVLESFAIPIELNANDDPRPYSLVAPLPDSLALAQLPDVYRFIRALPPDAVVAELPLGDPSVDVRYMLYSTAHWRRLVNGYSGGAPVSYGLLANALVDFRTAPDRAWEALVRTGATHV